MAKQPRRVVTAESLREFAFGDLVPRFAPERVRAAGAAARIARAVSAALADCGFEREAVAAEMTAYLGEEVSKGMLDAYASQAREGHNIPAHRLGALAVITGDARLLNVVLEGTGLIAISEQYAALLRRERAAELRDALQSEVEQADRDWRSKT
ncbi:MAG: hypothetical protein WD871_01625 [Xanthobacteraceae bacterium]